MNLIKYFVVFCLSFFFWACSTAVVDNDGKLNIDIGDYEAQLVAWNSLNMRNYQLLVVDDTQGAGYQESIVITIKNGIPESIEPPSSWLEKDGLTTIPAFFDYIKREEKSMRDMPKSGYKLANFHVYYHSELYYPVLISTSVSYSSSVPGAYFSGSYSITLTPLGEN
jgi:hypothetical protein